MRLRSVPVPFLLSPFLPRGVGTVPGGAAESVLAGQVPGSITHHAPQPDERGAAGVPTVAKVDGDQGVRAAA